MPTLIMKVIKLSRFMYSAPTKIIQAFQFSLQK